MDTFKRVLAGFSIATSAIMFVLCLAGIFTVWSINQQLTEGLTGLLDQTEAVLLLTRDELSQVDAQLEEAQDHLATLDQAITKSGDQLTENSPTMQLVSNLVGAQVAPKIETAAEVISTVRGTLLLVNSTLDTIRRLPFVSLPTVSMDQLASIDGRMQDLVNDINNLVETFEDMENGAIDRASSAILSQTNRLSNRIERVQTPLQKFSLRLSQIENRVSNAKARIPILFDWASILLTLAILWFMLAQAGLAYLGWYYWKSGALPDINSLSIDNS